MLSFLLFLSLKLNSDFSECEESSLVIIQISYIFFDMNQLHICIPLKIGAVFRDTAYAAYTYCAVT